MAGIGIRIVHRRERTGHRRGSGPATRGGRTETIVKVFTRN
ncbi:hypothetical protein BN903_1 [Halorubrum sp. AJ67]|nr:hypothetical protein BN903_1 [Halorubrum sp. AJ67]